MEMELGHKDSYLHTHKHKHCGVFFILTKPQPYLPKPNLNQEALCGGQVSV